MRIKSIRPFRHYFDKLLGLIVMILAGCPALFAATATVKTAQNIHPDLIFVGIYTLIIAICLNHESTTGVLITAYGGSLLFCLVYLIIAPFEAPFVMALFFLPALLWHNQKITGWVLLGISLLLIIFSGVILGRPAVLLLLFPTCHMLAMRVSKSERVRTRYSKGAPNVGHALSTKQQLQEHKKGDTSWKDFFKAEAKEIPQRVAEFWQGLLSQETTRESLDDTGPAPTLIQLQDPQLMSRALTDLAKRDPRFHPNTFRKRVEKVFWRVQKAWYGQKLESIQPCIADALFEQFRMQIEEQQNRGIRYQANNMTIYDCRIVQVISNSQFDMIHLYIRASSANAVYDLTTNELLANEEDRRQFNEYWTFLRRPTALTLEKPGLLEGFCPNCGAPIEVGNATQCASCRSYIRSGSYDWVLAKITQASEWEYQELDALPGWKDLQTCDPNISIQQIEDRAGVIFWMIRQAEQMNSADPLRRYSTTALAESYFSTDSQTRRRAWDLIEGAALGGIRLKAISLTPEVDRLYLLAAWSGIPALKDAFGKIIRGEQIPLLQRNILVLTRRHGLVTNREMTLSSAHCPNCGGPLASTYTVTCPYCETVLNEGSQAWTLSEILPEDDPKYRELLTRNKQQQNLASAQIGTKHPATDIITALVQVALADDKLDPREMKFLTDAASSRGISRAKLESIISSVKGGKAHVIRPANPKEAWEILISAAAMSMIDEELAEQEKQIINDLAHYMGYSPADVQRAFALAGKHRICEIDMLVSMISVMLANETETPEQHQLLARVAAQYGISPDNLKHLISDARSKKAHTFAPVESYDAAVCVQRAIEMALITGEIDEMERKKIDEIALRCKIDVTSLEMMILTTSEIQTQQPSDIDETMNPEDSQ